ncbi:thioredoxin-like protein CITRX, chloroplastic isoform X2 [Malania oleifera]|uniref:thioredoxin-like protein CITRX, chloroplastic isoform X2 n=1 Tax=Malania oleifera TaxID=397392 RepID=UPI0025AE3423|nr:thioredoxin-like protein CITRX, chloroplastic isoform X2 [Malania oleifera]
MAVLQTTLLRHGIASFIPISALHNPSVSPLPSHPHNPLKKTQQPFNSPFATNPPFSLSTQPRRLLCRPHSGKYLADDYLVKKYSAKEIQLLVKGERKLPLLIDFFAAWCGPCILMAQELEMLAVEYENKLLIVKVDTDEEYEFAHDMQREETC